MHRGNARKFWKVIKFKTVFVQRYQIGTKRSTTLSILLLIWIWYCSERVFLRSHVKHLTPNSIVLEGAKMLSTWSVSQLLALSMSKVQFLVFFSQEKVEIILDLLLLLLTRFPYLHLCHTLNYVNITVMRYFHSSI